MFTYKHLKSHCFFGCTHITSLNPCTTGNRQFAECLRHSAKPEIHSVKALPSAALGKEQSSKNPSAKVSLPSATYRALGKAFAECHVSTRQKKSDVNSDGLFASATSAALGKKISFFLKILYRVPYSCTRQRIFLFKKKSLPSAMALALGKAGKLGLCFPALPSAMVTALGKALFAECGTRQRGGKCYFFFVFCFPSAQTKKSHIYQHTAQDISHTHPYSITYTSITHHIHIHHP